MPFGRGNLEVVGAVRRDAVRRGEERMACSWLLICKGDRDGEAEFDFVSILFPHYQI